MWTIWMLYARESLWDRASQLYLKALWKSVCFKLDRGGSCSCDQTNTTWKPKFNAFLQILLLFDRPEWKDQNPASIKFVQSSMPWNQRHPHPWNMTLPMLGFPLGFRGVIFHDLIASPSLFVFEQLVPAWEPIRTLMQYHNRRQSLIGNRIALQRHEPPAW